MKIRGTTMLRKIRQEKRISKEQLAKMAKVSVYQIQGIENVTIFVSDYIKKRIATVLNVTIEELDDNITIIADKSRYEMWVNV